MMSTGLRKIRDVCGENQITPHSLVQNGCDKMAIQHRNLSNAAALLLPTMRLSLEQNIINTFKFTLMGVYVR